MGLDSPLFSTLQHMLDAADDAEKSANAPTRTYVRDAKAMAATPADISAMCQDGVLTVTVEKLPPPEPKKPKTIEAIWEDRIATTIVNCVGAWVIVRDYAGRFIASASAAAAKRLNGRYIGVITGALAMRFAIDLGLQLLVVQARVIA
ncbi:hypothetical protein L1049_018018 [Liquidambar formosana]|uniref:SHSP domain-containing protein n=1 Tax=Liquidambar formosana TaxID=63359 RepID=A0AAP0R9N0_LIQFO